MIAFVFRNWKLFLDILIVVAVIVAFTFWDPLNIFQNSKLKRTANVVTQVRDIAELVTAEYYGEVITSLKEAKMEESSVSDLDTLAKELFRNMKQKLGIEDRSSYSPDAKYQPIYQKFLALLGDKYLYRDLSKIYDEKTAKVSNGLEAKIIKRFKRDLDDDIGEIKDGYQKVDERNKALQKYKNEIPDYVADFPVFHASLTTKDNTAIFEKKENVVFIGRGWVKAGFDLSDFNENSFYYDESVQKIHFFGISPRILDKDINPWYIPERNIKGFDLVDYSGKVSFKEAQIVKAHCKEKLLLQAEYAGIYKQAQTHGKEALQAFFSLLLDAPALQVEFHADPYDRFFNIIAADTLITIEETLRIDTLYRNELAQFSLIENSGTKERSEKQLAAFLNRLKKLPFIAEGYGFNYYSILASKILKDSSNFSAYDRGQLTLQRGELKYSKDSLRITTVTTKADTLWFTSGNFMLEFNETIRLLGDRIQWQEDLLKVSPANATKVEGRIAAINGKQFYIRDTLSRTKQWRVLPMDSVKKKPLVLDDFLFDMRYIPILSTDLTNTQIDSLWAGLAQEKVPDEILKPFSKKPVIYNDSFKLKRDNEFQLLRRWTTRSIEKKKRSKPFYDTSKWFNDQITKIRKSQIL